MSELIQWVIVAVVVAIAARFLYLRFGRKGNKGACDGNCSGCCINTGNTDKCSGGNK